jgi:hypothetical protein
VVHFKEGREVGEEGEKKGEKMERDKGEKTEVKKGKWGNRGLSESVLEQNGEGSYVTVRRKKKMKKIKVKIGN